MIKYIVYIIYYIFLDSFSSVERQIFLHCYSIALIFVGLYEMRTIKTIFFIKELYYTLPKLNTNHCLMF